MKRRSFLKGLLVGAAALSMPAITWAKSKLKRKRVYSVNDLPKPINGVITLDENTVYEIQNVVDAGRSKITISPGSMIVSKTNGMH